MGWRTPVWVPTSSWPPLARAPRVHWSERSRSMRCSPFIPHPLAWTSRKRPVVIRMRVTKKTTPNATSVRHGRCRDPTASMNVGISQKENTWRVGLAWSGAQGRRSTCGWALVDTHHQDERLAGVEDVHTQTDVHGVVHPPRQDADLLPVVDRPDGEIKGAHRKHYTGTRSCVECGAPR